MNTILTDDEIVFINALHYDLAFRNFEADVAIARAVEAAVLAKLAQQADRQRVPDGYVLVSKDRLKALSASINGDCYMGEEWEKEAVAAMLAAAPEAPAQASAVDEREAFEAWWNENGLGPLDFQWESWQARTALAQKGDK